jgi:DNA-binding response OmpR family regulator
MKILWADDEVDLLRPHVLFLEGKGYTVSTVNNGLDAVEAVGKEEYDIIFLDENMPGLSGLETLTRIKGMSPRTPVIMITKSEEESIMEEAIGSKISDYLIKPVNPNQILLALKKHLDGGRLVSEKTTSAYQQQFGKLSMRLGDRLSAAEWAQLYEELVRWELELSGNPDQGMAEILRSQWAEANDLFSRFVEKNYVDWVNNRGNDVPLQSHRLFKAKVAPLIDEKQSPLFLVLIDNLRLDQWRVLEPDLASLVQGGGAGSVLQHSAHGHAVRAQRAVRGHDAGRDRAALPGEMAQRGRRGQQERPRGGIPDRTVEGPGQA